MRSLKLSLILVAAQLVVPAMAMGKASSSPEAPDSSAVIRESERISGFFDVYRNAAKGRVLLGVDRLPKAFLLISSLPAAVGSNDIGLDRGQSSGARLVEFRRVANRILLVETNTRYRAASSNPDEVLASRQAFAESVLWATDIVSEDRDGKVIIDVGSLLVSDQHGVGRQLDQTGQGSYALDKERSIVLAAQARSFPDNTELAALLTFAGPGKAEYVRDVVPTPDSLSVEQHLSFVRLPEPGYVPRAYHPASGGLSQSWFDYAQPLAASLEVRVQPRFRLEKLDPEAASSAVRKPIIFYVDRGAPEPVRSALLDGANWWASAFEKAGFKGGFRAELLPEGADPMDVRYNIITWAHRMTRGWSYGQPIIDPRTGEIIKGAVTLDSQRVRQDLMIAESLLAPYDKANSDALQAEAMEMALARVRQLAAHEVGHALGFAHNFAASRHGNGSVMDYPHPLVRIGDDGNIHLDHAYGVGVGPWDDFIVAHAYRKFAPDAEAAGLAELRAGIAKAGYEYASDADSRSPGDAHSDGLLWDFGPDTLATFDSILKVRRKALDGFSSGVLPPARQNGELEARLVPVYLLHRYQLGAVARLLGGVGYRYAQAGDAQVGMPPVAADRQRAALKRMLEMLSAEQLALPANVLDLVSPPASDYARTREYFATASGPVFDPYSVVEAGAAQTLAFLLAPERLNRMAWQHARDAAQPGVEDLLSALFAATWTRAPVSSAVPAGEAVQATINWVVLDAVLDVHHAGKLHASVAAEVRKALQGWQARLAADSKSNADRDAAANRIARYLADPASVTLRKLPPIPPGDPI